MRVPRDSPDMTPKNFSRPGSRDPLNFLALNANNSKTVKATDFKFDSSVPRDSPDMTPKNFSKRGRGQGHVTPKFLALNANSSKMVKATEFDTHRHLRIILR